MFRKLKDVSREKQLGVMSSDPPARETARLQKHWIQLLKQRADEGRTLGISVNVQESLSIREERLPQSPQSVKFKTQRVALCLNSARNRNKIQLFSSNIDFILKICSLEFCVQQYFFFLSDVSGCIKCRDLPPLQLRANYFILYIFFNLYFGLKKICHKYLLSSSLCAKLGMQNVFIVQVSHTLVFRSHSSLF